jgi:hypothetical protein
MRDALLPRKDFETQGILTIAEIAEWRNRLVVGLNHVGLARYSWIADSLGFDAPPDTTLN